MPTGSLRAPEGYHLPNAMQESDERYLEGHGENLFQKFGGHPCAAGFSIDSDNLFEAKSVMNEIITLQGLSLSTKKSSYCSVNVPDVLLPYTYRKDTIWINSNQITNDILKEVILLDPFGQDFALPNFGFECEFWNNDNIKWLGQDNKHFKTTTPNGVNLTFFGIDNDLKEFVITNNTNKLWVIAKPVQNAWRNNLTIELIADKWFVVG